MKRKIFCKAVIILFCFIPWISIGQNSENNKCFINAAKPQLIGEPLDWLTNPLPEKWKLDGQLVNFEWD